MIADLQADTGITPSVFFQYRQKNAVQCHFTHGDIDRADGKIPALGDLRLPRLQFAGRFLVHIFLESTSGVAMDTGVLFLRIVAPFYFIVAAKLVSDGILRGAGLMKKFMIATFTDLILRVALAEILSRTSLGTTGIWFSWPIGWTIATILSTVFYASTKWGASNKVQTEQEPSDPVKEQSCH